MNKAITHLAVNLQRVEIKIQCLESHYKELHDELQRVDGEISTLELQRESILARLIEMLAYADR